VAQCRPQNGTPRPVRSTVQERRGRLAPDVLERLRRHRGVANRVRGAGVAKEVLQPPRDRDGQLGGLKMHVWIKNFAIVLVAAADLSVVVVLVP